jgi:hypothetical protein|tara:strand:- start:590 stop:1177 length:588 start_codon:yes stop_codon:yes gene_type:complete
LKNFLTVSLTTFLFSSVLWILWAFFLLQGDDNFKALGPLLYYPHAARVLCIVYFGYKAIPALFLAEIWGPLLLFPEAFSFYPYIPSIISVMSVPMAIITLDFFDFKLGSTRDSPLNKTNYKHVALITVMSAFYNALFKNLSLSLFEVNYQDRLVDILQVCQFLIGDILGTIIVVILLVLILRPILRLNYQDSKIH